MGSWDRYVWRGAFNAAPAWSGRPMKMMSREMICESSRGLIKSCNIPTKVDRESTAKMSPNIALVRISSEPLSLCFSLARSLPRKLAHARTLETNIYTTITHARPYPIRTSFHAMICDNIAVSQPQRRALHVISRIDRASTPAASSGDEPLVVCGASASTPDQRTASARRSASIAHRC